MEGEIARIYYGAEGFCREHGFDECADVDFGLVDAADGVIKPHGRFFGFKGLSEGGEGDVEKGGDAVGVVVLGDLLA